MAVSREIHLEEKYSEHGLEAGCDEAGRGPLAGPVFAAAVILPPGFSHPLLDDSKKMSGKDRCLLRDIIMEKAVAYAVEAVTAEEIDRINILNASIAGMWRAVMNLPVMPQFLAIDGNRFKPYGKIPAADGLSEESIRISSEGRSCGASARQHAAVAGSAEDYARLPYECIIKGDAKFADIAAASVLAKTARDEYMRRLAADYPQYGWDRNMGYPTKEHIEAIRRFGLTPHHRKSFHVKELEPSLF